MWNRIFDVDNAVFRAIDTIGKIFILNLYWVICSLPIFTIGASTSALLYASMKLHDKEGYVTSNFFSSFKENFKQSTAMWLILLMLSIIPTLDLYIVNSLKEGIVVTALKGLLLGFALAILFVFLYAMALQSTFENTIKTTLKNALLMGIGHFPWTLLILCITLLPVILIIFLGKDAVSIIYIMLFAGFALLAYLNSYILNFIFKKYM